MQEYIAGGKANGMDCKAIAEKHKVDVSEIEAQVKKGISIEHEHTSDNNIAAEIARDHLVEHPFYYDFLEEMEKEMEIDYDNEEYGKEPEEEEEPEEDKKDSLTPGERIVKAKLKKLFG